MNFRIKLLLLIVGDVMAVVIKVIFFIVAWTIHRMLLVFYPKGISKEMPPFSWADFAKGTRNALNGFTSWTILRTSEMLSGCQKSKQDEACPLTIVEIWQQQTTTFNEMDINRLKNSKKFEIALRDNHRE